MDEQTEEGEDDLVDDDDEVHSENDVNDDEAVEDQADPAGDDQESSADEANGDEVYAIDLPDAGGVEPEKQEEQEVQEQKNNSNKKDDRDKQEHEMSALEAEIARVLDERCSQVQQLLAGQILTQKSRLTECQQRLLLALQQRRQLLKKHEYILAQSEREREKLQINVALLEEQLQREREERVEERAWIAELWPANVPLPTLLVSIKKPGDTLQTSVDAVKPVKLVKDLTDDHERKRLEALMTKRVERERVRQQLEAASHWELILPETADSGDAQMPYYTNTCTGVSVWDVPVAMTFEAPPGWNMSTMDWEDGYEFGTSNDNDHDNEEEMEDGSEKTRTRQEEEEDVPMDPMPARERFEEELKRYEELRLEVEQSTAKQRSLALEVLTAKRELFEREQEILKEEDAVVIAIERKRRIAEREDQAAVKAKAEAQQRKAQQSNTGRASVPMFARDSVAKKGLTLAADDQVFEQELRDFAVEQRAERLYLSMPLTRDLRVRDRHRLEPEFVHMKHVESRVVEAEKLEYDLLEKSSLRHEEAAAKSAELRELCQQIRNHQENIEEELNSVNASIIKLETALSPPEQPRPTQEELERAAGRYLMVDPLSDDEDDDINDTNDEFSQVKDSKTEVLAESTREEVTRTAHVPPIYVDDTRMIIDESELRELKSFTDAERAWRQWEKSEKTRNTKLRKLSERQTLLTTSQKQLAVDLALYEDADAPFFEHLSDLEKTANTRMWDLQAQMQVVRARFVVERAAHEESVFQLRDRLNELQQQLDDASALPRQAIYPLERLELEAQSEKLIASLKRQEMELQARYVKEETARALLISLELRSCDYIDAKLKEETKLFAEKQALWDLNFTLEDELQSCRQTIERLYFVIQQEKVDQGKINEEKSEEAALEVESQTLLRVQDVEPYPRELYEENALVFETKLEYLQQVRRFLLLCYDREDRWRELSALSLMKDTTSDDWMTSMQLSRQEDMLALLQTQHEEQQQALQNQLKFLSKVKTALHKKVEDLTTKLHKLQRDYQAASESVRLQTQEVIQALRIEIEEHKTFLEREKLQFRYDREQLIRQHDVIRKELEERVQTLDNVLDTQTHWLTASKRELQAQRVANEELLKAYQSLEKRRAAEVNDLRFRISTQLKKLNNLEMWNLSMKISAKEAHTDFINMQKELTRQQQQHKQLQRGLRLVNWRHRVTAQKILTDVNLLFSFFADGVAIIAGATRESNDSLRDNAGIEVLAALARHSSQQSIRVICARALGQLCWNANATARSLGWKAKHKWFQWMETQSNMVLDKLSASKTAFDAIAQEKKTEMNWLADPSAFVDGISGECDHDLSSSGGKLKAKKLRFLATWQQFDDKVFPDTNVANQQYMALSSNVLQTILDLCRSPATDQPVKSNALHSLALIVRNSRNTSIIGRLDGSIALLVGLLELKTERSQEEPQVIRHAAQALATLAYRNAFNQQIIYNEGGIPLLLGLCHRTVNSSDPLDADVDLTLAITQALSHLSYDHVLSCQAIVESHGISILMKLCNSPRIHDAIDLEVYEQIQTYASQVIANVMTLLDNEDSESDYRSYHIVDFILEKQPQTTGNSSKVGFFQGKLEHDNQKQLNDEQTLQQSSKYADVAIFVLMCASCNRNVAFHGAVVLGSIAQHDAIRGAIGAASGMDVLFLLAARTDDLPMVAQATWALANLTWNRDNQYRVACYITQLYHLCTLSSRIVSLNQQEADQEDEQEMQVESPAVKLARRQQDEQLVRQIREHGLCILANCLFYNEANRQLIASLPDWMQLLGRNALNADGATLENSARALCSLSYSDSIAVLMGTTIFNISSKTGASSNSKTTRNGLGIFIQLCGQAGHVAVQQHGLFGVINMCLHDVNKTRLLEIPHAIDTLVNLSGHMDKDLCEPALEALELLADMRQLKQEHGISSTQSFESVELKKLIALLFDATSPSLVASISDAIADQVWKRPSAQIRLRNEHGLEKLLEICVKASPLFPTAMSESSQAAAAELERRVRISCLWALRNTVANNVRNQDVVGALDGVQQLVRVFDHERQSEEVVEALLAALVALVMKHARNSQQLVQFGLDILIGLADGAQDGDRHEEDRRNKDRGVILPPLTRATAASPSKLDIGTSQFIAKTDQQLDNATLARELLHLVAPYNTRGDANAVTVSPDAKVRRMQQLHSSSVSPVHRR